MNSIKIVITDDHPLVINGIKNILPLYPQIQLVASFSNGESLLEGLAQEVPDVLLLDIQLPDKTGDELVPIILARFPSVKILVVTNFDSPLYANTMFTKGVHGYILKTANNETLIKAIEMVYQGGTFLEEDMKERMQQASYKVQKALAAKSSLTVREREIVQLIVNGLTNQQIAGQLFLSAKTVDNYRTNIMLKLDVNNVAALVKKALQTGLAD